MNSNIDFVVTWVDPSDPKWQSEKRKYYPESLYIQDTSDKRYRDWGIFPYWFRAVDRYAPWVDKIHLVTFGHIPHWLNINHPKIRIVRHTDFMPPQYLPVFSSHPLELNLHRIPGLAEQFVYFNDDVLLNKPAKPQDFFEHGLPRDFFTFGVLSGSMDYTFAHIYINNNYIINRNFNINNINKRCLFNLKCSLASNLRNLILSQRNSISPLRNKHMSISFLKSSFIRVWEKEYAVLDATCHHRFRDIRDVSPYLIREWQLLESRFVPCSDKDFGIYCYAGTENPKVKNNLGKYYRMICINDTEVPESSFESYKLELNNILQQQFPHKSEFELG